MIRNLTAAACLAGLLAGGVYVFTGCENNGSTDNADFYIEPRSAVLTGSNTVVNLTAIGGHEPYAWTVSDIDLGRVTGSGADVGYVSTGSNGVNTVTVTDNLGWTASSAITYRDPSSEDPSSEDPSLTPDAATLTSDGDRVTFQAVGGELPYSWSVGNDDRGSLEPQGADQAIYSRKISGNNTVILHDSRDRVFIAQITQPLAAPLDISPQTAAVSTDGGMVVFTASGGTGSYSWSRQSGAGGLSDDTGDSTVLTVLPGTDAVIVRLSDGITTVFATVDRN